MNPSGIEPIEYNVLVKQEKVQDRIGNVYVPDEHKDREQGAMMKALIVEVSPMAFSFEEWPKDKSTPQAGQWIITRRYAGTEIKGVDGEDYHIVKDKDILAVFTPPAPVQRVDVSKLPKIQPVKAKKPRKSRAKAEAAA